MLQFTTDTAPNESDRGRATSVRSNNLNPALPVAYDLSASKGFRRRARAITGRNHRSPPGRRDHHANGSMFQILRPFSPFSHPLAAGFCRDRLCAEINSQACRSVCQGFHDTADQVVSGTSLAATSCERLGRRGFRPSIHHLFKRLEQAPALYPGR